MSTAAPTLAPQTSAIQRYFEVSLYLLVAVGVLTVISTGKLELVSTILPPAVLVFKFVRYARGKGPELSSRTATWLVLIYFLFFPVDLWFVSRTLAVGAPNPALYAGLLASIHLMLFALLVRLCSARTNRDYVFLAMLAFTAMLAAAIFTVDSTFLFSLAFFLIVKIFKSDEVTLLKLKRRYFSDPKFQFAFADPLGEAFSKGIINPKTF